jgi:hypothetical protein
MQILHQIRHPIYRAGDGIAAALKKLWPHWKIMWRWYLAGNYHQQAHALPGRLVVSLTSYPKRFKTLAPTLKCLLRQTIKADHIILWIAREDFDQLPKAVVDLQRHGLEIRTTVDLRSYKKIIPAIDHFPNSFICTADDDVYYSSTWLEELVIGARGTEKVINCHRAHELRYNARGEFEPYQQWRLDLHEQKRSKHIFPTGVGGILYPPGILTLPVSERDTMMKLCPMADDVVLYWIGRRNGATYQTVGRWRELEYWYGSQVHALWRENVFGGGNDVQIRELARRYGYPDRLREPAF